MARREPTRKIKLPPLGGGGAPAQRQTGPVNHAGPRRPTGPGPGPAPAANDDVGQALSDLDRSAKIRSKADLPDRVKVITPAVIHNIVHSIVDRFAGGADAEQLAQLATETTQLQLKLQQKEGKLQGAMGEIERLRQMVDELQGLLDNAVQGQASADDNVNYYMDQIRELQQRNATAVDTYMDLQRQNEALEGQLQESEAAGEHTAAELIQLRDEVAKLREVAGHAQDASTAAEDLGAQVDQLTQQIEELTNQNMALQGKLDEMEAADAEHSEGANQEQAAREEAERERDEMAGRITALNDELSQVRDELATAKAAEERVAELEVGLADVKAQLEEERAKAQGELAESDKKGGERVEQLEKKNRELSDELREANIIVRKFDNVSVELEKLRMAEGQWLESKRQLASQLSHETNLRRDADQKLKAIEKGEIVPPGTSKVMDAAAKQAKAELEKANAELAEAKAEIEKLRGQAQGGAAAGKELEAAKRELSAAKKEAEDRKSELEAARKEIATLKSSAGELSGEAKKQIADLEAKAAKAEEKNRNLNDQLKEANIVVRKFDNVAAELEKLRAAEGQWLEQKRQLAAQLTHETNLRREVDAKLKAIEKG